MESFCFLEQTGQLGRKSTLKVFLPLWGSSETPANPGCAAQELGKTNKQTDQCKARPQLRRCFHFLTGQALRWGRVIRPLVFPQLRGSAVWRFLLMRCTAGTGKQQLSRVNICLCASPDRLGKPRGEKPENCSRIRSDGPKPASQHRVPRGQEYRLRCKFHTDGQVRHQRGWRGRFICTSTSLSSSPLAPAEPTLSALFPLLNPSVLRLSSLPSSSPNLVQLQAVTQKDDTSEKCPDASAISILPGIRWISESAACALSGLLQPASCPSETPT